MLTIDRNTKRVYLSFTRTKYADNFDRIKPGTCGQPSRTQVLMNCTYWAKSRQNASTPSRYQLQWIRRQIISPRSEQSHY
jgi:hypothetical protein